MISEEKRVFLIDATTDERAEVYYGKGWRCLDTIPKTGLIECLSVTGLVREVDATRPKGPIRESDAKGPRRRQVYCDRKHSKIEAIAWRSQSNG